MPATSFLPAGVLFLGMLLSVPALHAQEKATPAAPRPAEKSGLDADDLKLDDPAPAPALPEESLPPPPPPAPKEQPQINFPGLEKLPADQRAAVTKAISEAAGYMQGTPTSPGVRLQETLEKLNEVEAIAGEIYLVANMRGAVFTKMRDFKTARGEFQKAVDLTKEGSAEGFHPRFNISELDFVEHKWDAARKGFQKLLPQTNDKGTQQLMTYKILICNLKEGKGAGDMLKNFDRYDNDSPVWYFAQAAIAFAEDKKEEAEEWRNSAGRIYPPNLNEIYQDSLVEVGWLQTL